MSSADDPSKFWVPCSGDDSPLGYEPFAFHATAHTVEDYKREILRVRVRAFGHNPGSIAEKHLGTGGEGESPWFDLLTPDRRAIVMRAYRSSAAGVTGARLGGFGLRPVLLVVSCMGGGWRMFTRQLKLDQREVHLHSMEERLVAHGILEAQEVDAGHRGPFSVTGFPGWESVSGDIDHGSLELVCAAFGGSDPGNRNWAKFGSELQHSRSTLANLVGIVLCCTQEVHFDISQFLSVILHPLQNLIGDKRTASLPIAIVCSRKKNRGVPEDQFQWCPDSNVTRFFMHDSRATAILDWIYHTRIAVAQESCMKNIDPDLPRANFGGMPRVDIDPLEKPLLIPPPREEVNSPCVIC